MTETCPRCGATTTNESCSDRFWTGQQLELEQPAMYAVHHLSVPAYYLQHNLYARNGWLAARRLMGEFLFEGLTPQYARVKYRGDVDSGKRTESITRGAKLEGVEQVAWSVTIVEVRLDDPAHYCEDVRRWAEAVYHDTEALVEEVE